MMRFSSDQQFFQQNSIVQEKNQDQTPKKKQKKQTMLSKFLQSIDKNLMKKLLNYQKQKRPVFQKRNLIPPKISLYEDVLFIILFKQNQQKILSDTKEIKTILTDLESRTKRKQCTIKQRIQKKVCKMSPNELLDHITNDKDISFNLKKVLTSSSKVDSQKNQNANQTVDKQNKEESKMGGNSASKSTGQIQEISPNKRSQNDEKSSKKEQIYEEQIEQEKIVQEQKSYQKIEQLEPVNPAQIDLDQIQIIFNKEKSQFFLINQAQIYQQIDKLIKQQKQKEQKQLLISQLKSQLEVIQNFKKSATIMSPEVYALIQEAENITKMLGIICGSQKEQKSQNQYVSSQEINEESQEAQNQINQQNGMSFNQKHVQKTSDKTKNQQEGEKINPEVSQFQMNKDETENVYTMQYSLCQNPDYINLYKSNPQVFQPLLWTIQQDSLIQNLINDFKTNQKLFDLLIRYKSPEMFVQRLMFLKKNISKDSLIYQGLKKIKPLNMGKINNMILDMDKLQKMNQNGVQIAQQGDQLQVQKINETMIQQVLI